MVGKLRQLEQGIPLPWPCFFLRCQPAGVDTIGSGRDKAPRAGCVTTSSCRVCVTHAHLTPVCRTIDAGRFLSLGFLLGSAGLRAKLLCNYAVSAVPREHQLTPHSPTLRTRTSFRAVVFTPSSPIRQGLTLRDRSSNAAHST